MPVLFNEPDLTLQAQIHNSVQHYFDTVAMGRKTGGVFGVTTRDAQGNTQSNAVIVIRKGDKLEVAGYIGKTWGEKGVVTGVEGKFLF
jgi:hypothetical protein